MVFKLPGKLDLEKASKDKKFRIKGFMSAPIVDAENEILSEESYQPIIDRVKARAAMSDFLPVVIEHRRAESLPVGYIEDAYVQDGKLGFTAVIASGGAGSLPDTVQQLISQKVLRHVSIGGDINQDNDRASEMVYDSKSKKYVRKINDAVIRELSLTGLPVNEEATFTLAKSLNLDKKGVINLMKRLDKAVSKEVIGSKIDKAITDSDLGAVEDALKNLAEVLKDQFNVDIDVEALTQESNGVDNATSMDVEDNAEDTDVIAENETELEVAEVPEEVPEEAPEVLEGEEVTEEIEDVKEQAEDVVNADTAEEVVDETEDVVDETKDVVAETEDISSDVDTTEVVDETDKAIEEVDSTDNNVETKIDKLIEVFQELKGKINKPASNVETDLVKSQKNNLNEKGGEQEMEKRLICKSCGEDFSYDNDDSIEKSFKFCPVCSKPLSKALIDNELNKVYYIESVVDAKKVNDETNKNAVIHPEGGKVTESSLSGKEGEIDSANEEAAKNAVIRPEGYPLKESHVAKSEEGAEIEKNLKEVQIRDKVQGNELSDFPKDKVPYLNQNGEDVRSDVLSTNKEDQFNREGFPTLSNQDAGTVDQKMEKSIKPAKEDVDSKIEKSIAPIKDALEAIQKSIENSSTGRKALFVNPNKLEKSMPSKEKLENDVFLSALFSK